MIGQQTSSIIQADGNPYVDTLPSHQHQRYPRYAGDAIKGAAAYQLLGVQLQLHPLLTRVPTMKSLALFTLIAGTALATDWAYNDVGYL